MLFGTGFHQVSIDFIDEVSMLTAVEAFERMGYHDWVIDRATMECELPSGTKVSYEAVMYFNYTILGGGLELELMCNHGFYLTGRGPKDDADSYVSHHSVHVDNLDETIKAMAAFGLTPAIRFTTTNHTNPAIAGKRHFKEAVFATQPIFGFDMKFIERVWDDGYVASATTEHEAQHEGA
jgi:hypothetical protein